MNTKSEGQATIGLTILLCFFSALFEGFDIQSAGVAAPRLALALNIDDAMLKWVFSANIFGLLVGAIVGGRLADAIGRKRVLVMSMIAFGIFSLGSALVHTVEPLILMRLLTGLGLGGAMPNMLALAAENSPSDRRGLATAIMYCGMPLGGAVASFTSMFDAVSWQQIFYIGGFAPLLAAPLMAWVLPESRGFQALRHASSHASDSTPTRSRASIWFALFGEGRAGNTLLLWAAYGLTLLVMYGLLNWLPIMLHRLGLTRPQASIAQIFFNVGGASCSVLIGFLLDRTRRLLTVSITYACMCAALLALALLQPQLLLDIYRGVLLRSNVDRRTGDHLRMRAGVLRDSISRYRCRLGRSHRQGRIRRGTARSRRASGCRLQCLDTVAVSDAVHIGGRSGGDGDHAAHSGPAPHLTKGARGVIRSAYTGRSCKPT